MYCIFIASDSCTGVLGTVSCCEGSSIEHHKFGTGHLSQTEQMAGKLKVLEYNKHGQPNASLALVSSSSASPLAQNINK